VRTPPGRQAGFTLTELMVVVTIIGVLVTMAVVYMRPRVRPVDVATRFGDLVHEANRRAVALGPVRADVVVALGSKARTQILATQSGTVVTFTLYRLEEAALGTATGTWMPIGGYATDRTVEPVQWAPGVGNLAMAGITPVWTGFVVQCKPDGTCTPATLFFRALITPTPDCTVAGQTLYEWCAKMSVMTLGGAITTATDWF
jgi:prepilin-type N-terminal cleavage/methylation domain-containing protein